MSKVCEDCEVCEPRYIKLDDGRGYHLCEEYVRRCYVCKSEDTVFEFSETVWTLGKGKFACRKHLPEKDPRNIGAQSQLVKSWQLRKDGPDDCCVYCDKKVIDPANFIKVVMKSEPPRSVLSDVTLVPIQELKYWACKVSCRSFIIDPRDPKKEKNIASLVKKREKIKGRIEKIEQKILLLRDKASILLMEDRSIAKVVDTYDKDQCDREMKQYREWCDKK